MRYLACGLLALSALTLAGCGSSRLVPASPTDLGSARVALDRLVPSNTALVTVTVWQGSAERACQTVTRPAASAAFDSLPVGGDYWVAAEARATEDGLPISAGRSTTFTVAAGQTATVAVELASTVATCQVASTAGAHLVGLGARLTLTALAFDALGRQLDIVDWSWTVSPGVAGLETDHASAAVLGLAVGSAQVTATVTGTGISATSSVEVQAGAVAVVLSRVRGPR